MERKKFNIHLQKKEISEAETPSEHTLTIFASEEEVKRLRKLFDRLHSADFTSFFRANVPIMPYHNAASNDEFDESYAEAAHMIYDLGDEETKRFIRESGIIGDRPINKDYSYPDPEHDGGKQA